MRDRWPHDQVRRRCRLDQVGPIGKTVEDVEAIFEIIKGEDVLDSTSFNKNYKILKETADWLSQQKEPDIDQLVPKVEKAMGMTFERQSFIQKFEKVVSIYGVSDKKLSV